MDKSFTRGVGARISYKRVFFSLELYSVSLFSYEVLFFSFFVCVSFPVSSLVFINAFSTIRL